MKREGCFGERRELCISLSTGIRCVCVCGSGIDFDYTNVMLSLGCTIV